MKNKTSEARWGIKANPTISMTHDTQETAHLQRQLAEAQDHASWLQQQHEQQLRSATKQQTKHQALMIAYQKIIDALQEDKAQLLFEKDQLLEDKAVLLGDIRMWEDESLEKDSQLAEYKQVIADLQFDISQLQADKASLLKDLHLQEKELAARESEVTECQQLVTVLQRVLGDKCLPPAYPMAVKAKPWTVPGLNKKIAQLTNQLGDLQEHCEELQQQSSVQDGRLNKAYDEIAQKQSEVSTLRGTVADLQKENMHLQEAQVFQIAESKKVVSDLQSALAAVAEAYDELALKEFEVSAFELTMINLQQQNLQLGAESRSALDNNHQLQDQVADQQSQLQHLQGMVSHLQQQDAEHQQKAVNHQVELTALRLTVIHLEQQNLQLGAQGQSMLATNHQLQDQVAVLQRQLQRLQGMVTDFEEQQADYQQKASEVSLLVLMVINLQQQNLRLAAQIRSALDIKQQLQDQVADLHSQLQHLQGVVSDVGLQQLLVERDSNTDDPDAPGTPELAAGSFSEVDGRRLQSDLHSSSNSRQGTATSLATAVSPCGRGNRRLWAGTAVVAAAGVLMMMMRRRSASI